MLHCARIGFELCDLFHNEKLSARSPDDRDFCLISLYMTFQKTENERAWICRIRSWFFCREALSCIFPVILRKSEGAASLYLSHLRQETAENVKLESRAFADIHLINNEISVFIVRAWPGFWPWFWNRMSSVTSIFCSWHITNAFIR